MTKRRTEGATEPVLVDARGLKCPWPVLRAARAMREGSAVLLLADDPVARTDVPTLARAQGWSVSLTEADNHACYLLEKSA